MDMAGRFRTAFARTFGYFRRNGISAAVWAVAERLLQEKEQRGYRYTPPAKEELIRQKKEAAGWKDPPLLSVVVPAYETPPEFLRALLESMQEQTWQNWELVVADAGNTDTVRLLTKERRDARIRYKKLAENSGIAGNTNAAVCEARGEYIGLLDHDDLLTPDALYEMARALKQSREKGIRPVLLYSDEDKCDGAGKNFYEPNRKPDFNLDLLLSNNYICHFLMLEADTFRRLGERPGFDGAQDYDLLLRAAAGVLSGVPEEAYVHVPKVLYHWRCHETSTASNPASKRYAYEAGKRALEDFCAVQGWDAQVEDTRHLGFYRIRYLPDILTVRKDVGAAAFPLPPRRGRLRSGIYDRKDGVTVMRYAGLPRRFSGYMHRAVLQQDVEAADVRAMRVRAEKELQKAWKAVERGEDPEEVSLAFCRKIRDAGLRICWEPWEGPHGGGKRIEDHRGDPQL
ncbi:MAG TPA: glycosyltransferase [Candidatus Eisenbergiella merdipullorum]|uniref:Glycosyltransferase n=1 Tax=Candidatus Eisenbergiella merdipullorum TaxID=2838553 RepID=A0A9D2I766_9FIRM|nr:glycosyltransferase [Candidatus Eisenbergiella merdipullorum]